MIERILWRLVLILLVVGCVLSLWAVFGGELSPAAAEMLVSSYGVAVYGAMALGCAAVVQRMPTSLGARAGFALALAGALLFVLGIWTHAAQFVWWWKAFGVTFVFSFAAVHASLLLLVNLDDR